MFEMTPVLLHEIKQRAQTEIVPLGQAITTSVQAAIKSHSIGLH